jgi:beta-fructofuranosidase
MSGGQYLLGDYDLQRDKFVVDRHGLFNFGATFPGGVHAPSATTDGDSVVVLFNMNPAKPTYKPDNFLSYFFPAGTQGEYIEYGKSREGENWDQIITLPRRLSLDNNGELCIEPAGDIESLRQGHCRIEQTTLTPNREEVLDTIAGDTIELNITVAPGPASLFEVNVLRSPDKDEYTRICFYNKRGNKYRQPLPDDVRANRTMSTALSTPVCHESVISIDTSYSSILPDAITRPPESAPVFIESGAAVELRIFVDRSVVEVFVNGKQCVAVRVYPGRDDSIGVSMLSRNQASELLSLDCWQMQNIYL